MRFIPSILIRAVTFVAVLSLPTTGFAQTMSCQASGDKAAKLRARAIEYTVESDYSDFRSDLGIGTVDTSQAALVTQDSICNAVTAAVNVTAVTPRATAMLVVKLGSFYFATDPEGDDIMSVYVLDTSCQIKTVFVT